MGSSKPRILDLFCGAGGAAVGYARAGFEVVGVDHVAQPNYPFEFIQDDALSYLRDAMNGERASWWLDDFDAIHASPPCQAYTPMSNRWRGAGGRADAHPDLIGPTRELLQSTGLPWVLENVPGAPLRSPVVVNGPNVGLERIDRPRWFESNHALLVPLPKRAVDPIGVYGKSPDGRRLFTRADGSIQRAANSLEEAQEVMGIDWMTWDELREAIPPAYTELIGHQLMQHLKARTAA